MSNNIKDKDKQPAAAPCAHVLTFDTDAGHTVFTCVKCGHSESVRNYNV